MSLILASSGIQHSQPFFSSSSLLHLTLCLLFLSPPQFTAIVALLLFCFWFCASVSTVVISALSRPLGRSPLLLSPAPRRSSWTLAVVRRLHWLAIGASAIELDSAAVGTLWPLYYFSHRRLDAARGHSPLFDAFTGSILLHPPSDRTPRRQEGSEVKGLYYSTGRIPLWLIDPAARCSSSPLESGPLLTAAALFDCFYSSLDTSSAKQLCFSTDWCCWSSWSATALLSATRLLLPAFCFSSIKEKGFNMDKYFEKWKKSSKPEPVEETFSKKSRVGVEFSDCEIIGDPGLRKPIDSYPYEIRDESHIGFRLLIMLIGYLNTLIKILNFDRGIYPVSDGIVMLVL
ncbi:hypothetical protein M9H77_07503 [Catharanthus roseus]|uniref:Uncharacterized protein n=1 Tax=Catharanthus roseus TaxID=4058 RepID=A0ACC0BV58_CATRO|nr:hypothetical protein M9H77_07503 [Catharanthus roseus]